jgi:mono/diheme cytochrome c family protein
VASAFCFGTLAALSNGSLLQAAEPEPLKAAAARVLDTSCARCHQASRLEGAKPESLFLNILDLDELASDPSLVRPGVADASPLYTVMLRQAMPPASGVASQSNAGPSDDDVQAIRDWINGLPPAPEAQQCGSAEAAITTNLTRLTPTEQQDARFIVLPCHAPGSAADQLKTAKLIVQHLVRSASETEIEPIVAGDSLFRISLHAIGMTADEWEHLVATYPDQTLPASISTKLASSLTYSTVPGVRADWLAHIILRGLMSFSSPPSTDTIVQLAPLARAWERDLDLSTAATEMSISRQDLMQQLAIVSGRDRIAARRLLQGLLPRQDFLQLRNSLIGSAETSAPATGAPPEPTEPFEFAIWSDKASYQVGDLLTLSAFTSADCHLTLIGLDANGQATVLFPNEMATDNRITAGSIPSLPGSEAPYQFRLDKPGMETVVGVCTVDAKIADNIKQDFDRQRFTLLGDWRIFLSKTWNQAAASSSRQQVDRRRRQSRVARRDPAPASAKTERPKPGAHVRTAITFEVK